MNFFRLCFYVGLIGYASGCGPLGFQSEYTASNISDRLAKSVAANESSSSYLDWHSSELHPERIFNDLTGKIIKKELTSEEICKGLLTLEPKDLTLFENEIRAEQNRIAVKSCLPELLTLLELYWKTQREDLSQLAVSLEDLRFETTKVILRDVSKGYFAVSGDLAPKQVMLTFDDGPSGLYTTRILSILKNMNVRALFFQLGKQVRQFPLLTQEVAKDGHSIGSHSTTHKCLASRAICRNSNGGKLLSYNEALAELIGGHQAIYDVLGWVDPFIRFPYGESSLELKAYLQKNSIGEFYWNVDSEDWKSSHTPKDVINLILSQLNSRGRGIILLHDIQRRTAEALPTLLKRLQQEGYQPIVMQPADAKARFNSKIIKLQAPKP